MSDLQEISAWEVTKSGLYTCYLDGNPDMLLYFTFHVNFSIDVAVGLFT